VCGSSEIVTAENAHVTYAAEQTLPHDARIFMTRAAKPGKDATVIWSVADIGAQLAVGAIDVIVENPGIDAQINSLFFPRDDQHVDLISTVEHNVGDSQSQTLIKSAATGRGQARYLGNIRIAPHAQATESALRDDALLLSKRAHIDSVPALEIAANDVKAYHGATVGALDEEQIFYMTSRGIAREDAEKMIALGFFEPVVERFPTEALRVRLREALQSKVTA
jgi:Fe-S cluster assembly protein SufD